MLPDHLGSTSILVDQAGTVQSQQYYLPYGDNRGGLFSTLTTKRFTGQYHEEALGLYFYGARWYDPLLGRFIQADTLIPDPSAPQAFNRYAYTLNNPLRYTDPSGHAYWGGDDYDDADEWVPPGGGGGGGGGGNGGGGGGGGGGGNNPNKWHYYCNNYYGCVDTHHFNPGKVKSDLWDPLVTGERDITLRTPLMGGSALFQASYSVESLSEEDLEGVALGIWLDFQRRLEAYQGRVFKGLIKNITSFSPEDLPTDYLAFVSASRGYSLQEILSILSEVSPMQGTNSKPSLYSPRNFSNESYLPMVIERNRSGYIVITQRAWPAELAITPIGSEFGLWRFTGSAEESHPLQWVIWGIKREFRSARDKFTRIIP